MSTSMVRVADNIDRARVAVVDADDAAALVGRWCTDDTGNVGLSPNVAALARAIRRGQWARVHAIADHLSMSVEVVP